MQTLFPDNRTAKAHRTNIINRAIICALEDIGLANMPLVMAVVRTLLKMQKNHSRCDPTILAALIERMALSPKTRLPSHAWHAYAVPANDALRAQHHIHIDTSMTLETMKKSVLVARDPSIFHVAYHVHRIKDKMAIRMLWDHLQYHLVQHVHKYLHSAYMSLSENRPALQLALCLILYPKAMTDPLIHDMLPQWKTRWQHTRAMSALESGQYNYIPHPSAVDKHTARGRRKGADRKQFVREGAQLSNPHPEYQNDVLYDIHVHSNE